MVAALVHAGDITDNQWERAFAQVPRHKFVPRFYRSTNYQEVDGTSAEFRRSWLDAVYSDETLITQKTSSTVTSSGTMPGLIALMLNALDVHDGHRVLQVGTGTGYTAALLCERLGSNLVTTVDIDSELADTAQTRLASAGYRPTVVAGNGAEGFAPRLPYDRIMATCALDRIPDAWLAQMRPGSRAVAPLATGLIVLDVHSAKEASGRFLPTGGYFMRLRSTADRPDSIVRPKSTP
ncbi:MAG: methyltransferase domain-containing protein, partial [Gammaproteobacteria bacterium]